MRETIDLIDITPSNNNLSPEDVERHHAENQPRGHEGLEDYNAELKKLEERRAEIIKELHARGKDVESVENQTERRAEKKTGPAALGEKTKKSETFRAYVTAIVKKHKKAIVIMGIAAGLSAAVTAGSIANASKDVNKNAPAPAPAAVQEIVVHSDDVEDTDVDETETALDNYEEEAKGIEDGYDKEGMWTDEDKPNTVAFADFQKVIEMHDGDVKEAIKDVATCETEALSDYVSALDDKLRPAGFEGLNMTETNDKIENQLSAEEYDEALQGFKDTLDQAEVKEITVNGKRSNAYEAVKDGDDLLGSKEALEKGATIDHETMQLIQCSTNEKNTKAYELTWRDDDGKVICTMVVKGSCAQVLSEEGSKRLVGLPEATEQVISGGGPITGLTTVPDNPTPTPTPKKPKPKNAENLQRIDQNILNDIATDIGTGQVVVTPNPGVLPGDLTDNSFINPADIVQNDNANNAEVVQPSDNSNNYSDNQGPANPPSENAVQDNNSGQAEADKNESTSAPTSGSDLKNALGDLGID